MLLFVLLHFCIISHVLCIADNLELTLRMCKNGSLSQIIEGRRGSNLSLTCGEHTCSENTVWTRFGITVAKYRLTFNPVRLKHQGGYICTCLTSKCSLSVYLHVLPYRISSKLKEKVFDYIYPKHKRSLHSESSSDSDSSSSKLHEKYSDLELSYRDFWIVVFIIFMIGLGLALIYYVLKRYWWKAHTSTRCCRLSDSNLRNCAELLEVPMQASDLLPPYITPIELDDLPPSYEQAVSNKNLI